VTEKHDDDQLDDMHYLYEEVEKFIAENQITCPETIYQSDRVNVEALEFIERLCEIVGYCELENCRGQDLD
jgi:hypothetical protein